MSSRSVALLATLMTLLAAKVASSTAAAGSAQTMAQHHPRVHPPNPTFHANLPAHRSFVKNCGYVNGNLQLPLDCPPGYDCMHDGAASVSGCCPTASTASRCELATTCIDYSAVSLGVSRALTCDESQPFCTTAYFVDGYAMFTCGNGHNQTPLSAFYHASMASEAVRSGDLQQQQSSASADGTPGRTSISSGGNGGDSGSSKPLGVIVGGVISGVAVIVLASILACFVILKKRKDRSTSSNGASTMPKAPGTWVQLTEVDNEKKPPAFTYSELPTPPVELPETGARYAHEAPLRHATPTAVVRSEMPASKP